MSLLDILFPKKCVGCKKFGEYLCPNCFATLSFAVSTTCLVCHKPSFNGMTHPKCKGKYVIDGYFAALNYKGVLKKLIYQFKYSPYLTDLQTVLGDLLYEQLIEDEEFMKIVQKDIVLIPIPLSKEKLRKRGYNHAEILAKNLGKRFGLSVQNMLKRTKETKPQYGLKREERLENIKGAFAVIASKTSAASKKQALSRVQFNKNMNKIAASQAPRNDKIALFVDDIVTTGSTLVEAANVLKRNGFEKVYGVILAQD
ncbi:MAG TPA: ComF family protein [Patescibacteria group bacterium]|nr:ComF family protein [Patescibacteria group bacterium]